MLQETLVKKVSQGLSVRHPFCFGRFAVAFSSDKKEQHRRQRVNITQLFSSPALPSLLKYFYCSGFLTLPTHVNSREDLVFSELARRKEITDHLWEGEENQCPFCAFWDCIAFSQSISQDHPFCTLPTKAPRALTRDASLDGLKDHSHSEKAFIPYTEL